MRVESRRRVWLVALALISIANAAGAATPTIPSLSPAPVAPPAGTEYEARKRAAAEDRVGQMLAAVVRKQQREQVRAELAARRSEIDALVAERLQQGMGRSPAAGRRDVEAEWLDAAAQAEEQAETQAAGAAAATLIENNRAEIDAYLAARVAQLVETQGLGQRSEAEIREQLLQEVKATFQSGIRSGRALVRSKAAAITMLDADAAAAVAAADQVAADLPALDPEDAYRRLRMAEQGLDSVTLKMEALQRTYLEVAPRAAALRERLGDVRRLLASRHRQRAEQAASRAAEAAELLAGGNTQEATLRLKEAARLHPADASLVTRIVALQRDLGRDGRRIFVNGLSLEADPMVVENRTLVPLRAVAEALGAQVDWDGATRTVTFGRGDLQVRLTIDSKEIAVNSRTVMIDVPARIYDSRTHVPLRAVAEMLNARVTYDNDTRAITVVDPEPPEL